MSRRRWSFTPEAISDHSDDLVAASVRVGHQTFALAIQIVFLRVRRHPGVHSRHRQLLRLWVRNDHMARLIENSTGDTPLPVPLPRSPVADALPVSVGGRLHTVVLLDHRRHTDRATMDNYAFGDLWLTPASLRRKQSAVPLPMQSSAGAFDLSFLQLTPHLLPSDYDAPLRPSKLTSATILTTRACAPQPENLAQN